MIIKILLVIFVAVSGCVYADSSGRLDVDVLTLEGWSKQGQQTVDKLEARFFSKENHLDMRVFTHAKTDVALIRLFEPLTSYKSTENTYGCVARGMDFFFPDYKHAESLRSVIQRPSRITVVIDGAAKVEECQDRYRKNNFITVKGEFSLKAITSLNDLLKKTDTVQLCSSSMMTGSGFDQNYFVKFNDHLVDVYSGVLELKLGEAVYSLEFEFMDKKPKFKSCFLIMDSHK